jgi:DNA topoisomerase I
MGPADRRSAQAAHLTYTCDRQRGIRRERAGRGFCYIDRRGRAIRKPVFLERIRRLAIPPAWTDVWMCPDPRGHLQATGRDARGRKQYRYHPHLRIARDETKFGWTLAFSTALSRIRRRVSRHLARSGLPRKKVLATVVRLLERTMIRVGNEENARANRSFGLTTLRDSHVAIGPRAFHLCFAARAASVMPST